MLTNWQTISKSIARLRELDEKLGGQEVQGLTKREQLGLSREQEKLERALGGIKEMGGLPDILFIIDTNKEDIAVAEANKLGIPVVGVIDSNSNPAGITYPIPGNDDAIRAISMYCNLVADSVLDGLSASLTAKGVDLGADENAGGAIEPAVAEEAAVEAAPEAAATPETPAEGEEAQPAS
jgi:small subunit ribosomal protein S2